MLEDVLETKFYLGMKKLHMGVQLSLRIKPTCIRIRYYGTDSLFHRYLFSIRIKQSFWDMANSRLGIGTNNPTQTLEVNGSINRWCVVSNSSVGVLSNTDLISLSNNNVTINGTLTTTGAITTHQQLIQLME